MRKKPRCAGASSWLVATRAASARRNLFVTSLLHSLTQTGLQGKSHNTVTASVRKMVRIAIVRQTNIFVLSTGKCIRILAPTALDFSPPGGAFQCKLAVTYHPAFLLRDPRQKKETWKDLQMVMRYLGLAMPQRSPESPTSEGS